MQDPTKVSEKVRDLIVKNKGNNITEINLGQEKQYLPTDNSQISIVITDTGSRYEIVISATDNSNGKTYEAKYESLTDLVSAVRDSGSLPAVNKEGPNLEGLAGLGFELLKQPEIGLRRLWIIEVRTYLSRCVSRPKRFRRL